MRMHIRDLRRGAAAAVIIFFAALLLSPTRPARAQSQQQRRDERRAEMEARQRALRTLSETLNKRRARAPADTRPVYQQVAEDFTQLQLKNYDLSSAAEPEAALDYRRIREDAAEVRRRASRLKDALALPVVEDDEEQKKDGDALPPEGLKTAIAALDALVKSFVWNPVFQEPDVLDVENSTKAARELEGILRLSEQIRKAAEARGREKNF